jgi:hypothetical protein
MPLESILWNIADQSEEVDIAAEHLDDLWMFELKDREFGAGDAYPFNYRRVRYQTEKAIIVTTERVSKDAKNVFNELIRDAARNQPTHPSEVVYVEGLNQAESVLGHQLSASSLSFAITRLRPVEEISGFSLGPIVAGRFGEEDILARVQARADSIFSFDLGAVLA